MSEPKQTVRDVLFQVWRDGRDVDDRYVSIDAAEAAINAHIVSVLEELKSKKAEYVDAVLIEHVDAAIAKINQEHKS